MVDIVEWIRAPCLPLENLETSMPQGANPKAQHWAKAGVALVSIELVGSTVRVEVPRSSGISEAKGGEGWFLGISEGLSDQAR